MAGEEAHPKPGSEAEIDALLEEFGGDYRAAIRALLHDLTMLAKDNTMSVSRGYVRGKVWYVKDFKKA